MSTFTGVFRLLRAAAPAMREAGRGAMVAVSSVMGTTWGWHDHVQYNAAKAGVVGLVRGLACDLGGDGIRVNGIAPRLHQDRAGAFHRALRSAFQGWRLPPSTSPSAATARPATSPT